MLVIPAIDLKEGRCVRLVQGDMAEVTEYSDDPLGMAAHWAHLGARRLHLVDLDGAFAGAPQNEQLIRQIRKTCPKLQIQLGGGIRTAETVAGYLDAGVNWVIIGTRAVEAPQFVADMCCSFPGRIMVGLDAREGWLATHGWTKSSNVRVSDLALQLEDMGAAAIIYTDIGRDGMGAGVNVESTRALAEAVRLPVIASGGVHSLADIEQLLQLNARLREKGREGLAGAITGRAVYEGTLDLTEAQVRCDRQVQST